MRKNLYSIADLCVVSDLQLHLPKKPAHIAVNDSNNHALIDVAMTEALSHPGSASVGLPCFRLPGVCEIQIREGGSVLISARSPESLRRNQAVIEPAALAALLRGSNYLVLNGAAVRKPDGSAMLLIGHAGTGKSTLAHAVGNDSHLLTDELIILRKNKSGFEVFAGPRYIKLWPDATERLAKDNSVGIPVRIGLAKCIFQIAPCEVQKAAVSQIIFVDPASKQSCAAAKISGVNAFKKLAWAESKWHDSSSRAKANQSLEKISELINQCNTHELAWSRRFPDFGKTVALLSALIK